MNITLNNWIAQQYRIDRLWVPCRICGDPTISVNTGLCDPCWEALTRLPIFIASCENARSCVETMIRGSQGRPAKGSLDRTVLEQKGADS